MHEWAQVQLHQFFYTKNAFNFVAVYLRKSSQISCVKCGFGGVDATVWHDTNSQILCSYVKIRMCGPLFNNSNDNIWYQCANNVPLNVLLWRFVLLLFCPRQLSGMTSSMSSPSPITVSLCARGDPTLWCNGVIISPTCPTFYQNGLVKANYSRHFVFLYMT